MPSITRRAVLFLCAIVFSLIPSAGFGDVYSIADLGALPGGNNTSVARGLNNHGQVVGYSNTANGPRAFIWTPTDGMQDLGALPGGDQSSNAYAINDSGQVVGRSSVAEGPNDSGIAFRAFSWTAGGGMQDLGLLPGAALNQSEARSINNSGQIVGWSESPPGHRAFKGSSPLEPLAVPALPADQVWSYANAINGEGATVGTVNGWGESGPEPYSFDRPFLWDADGQYYELGALPGGNGNGEARDINDARQIVGHGDSNGKQRAFLWTADGGMQDLGDLPGGIDYSSAAAINNGGLVVGTSHSDSGLEAFLWSPDTDILSLTGLLDASGDGWTLQYAYGINDAGQIVGVGINPDGLSRAYLLTPVPEPSGIVLLCSSLAAAILFVRWPRRNLSPIELSRTSRKSVACTIAILGSVAFTENVMADSLRVSVQATGLEGGALTSVAVGETFTVQLWVQDIRNPPADFQGVFSAGADIHFNPSLASPVPGSERFGSIFDLARQFTAAPGVLRAHATTASLSTPGNQPQLLFESNMTAMNSGQLLLTPLSYTDDWNLYLLYGIDDAIPLHDIVFVGDALEILVPEPSSIALLVLALISLCAIGIRSSPYCPKPFDSMNRGT